MTKPTPITRIVLVALLAIAVLFVCVTALANDGGGDLAPHPSLILVQSAFADESSRSGATERLQMVTHPNVVAGFIMTASKAV